MHLTVGYALTPVEAAGVVLDNFKDGNVPDAIFYKSDEILTGVMKSLLLLKVFVPKQTGVLALSNGFFP